MKVGIIGAGNVGATLASRIAEENLADIVLLDIVENIAKGKAEDINDSLGILKSGTHVHGTSDYKDIRDVSIVVITAGLPRQPGMSREELLRVNLHIVKGVSKNISKYCKKPIIIVVTNPLDIMTYVVLKETRYPKNRIFGMAGTLDGERLINAISKILKVAPSKINPAIIGPHSNDMIILPRFTKISGKSLSLLAGGHKLEKIFKTAREKGAYIVSLLGKGSAYFAPSQAVFSTVQSIIMRRKRKFYISCYLDGQYGVRGICIGVPALIGKNGIEKIVELPLNKLEQEQFIGCAGKLKKTIESLGM